MLLPPSESKATGGDGPRYDPAAGAFGALAASRRAVAKALRARTFDPSQLGVRGQALAHALVANKELAAASTLPALRRYTGVLYDALGFAEQSTTAQELLRRDVVIISGLLGAVAGGDPVPAYKLPIGARVPELGRLGAFWKPRLKRALTEHVTGAVIWDLLPGAHAAVVPPELGERRWKLRVVRERGGRRSTVSHDNKAVKGALARTLVAEQITDPSDLEGWEGPGGYRVVGVTGAGTVELLTRR